MRTTIIKDITMYSLVDISEEQGMSIVNLEDEGTIFLWNVRKLLSIHKSGH
jgi:hypothetical protein